MSAFTDEIGKLLDEVKAKIHNLLDSSAVKNEETDVKQQVTQVLDDAKADAGNLAKEAGADLKSDVSAVTNAPPTSNPTPQVTVDDPGVSQTK